MEEKARCAEAIRRFEAENARDPNQLAAGGGLQPKELVYARWLVGWIRRLCPHPSEALLLAGYSQHLCRWMISRDQYPATRAGYLRWRTDLKNFHARRSREILSELGYDEVTIARVNSLNRKENLATDAECQTLEDALCLVTLEHQLLELMTKNDSAKMIGILQKTWRKMSPQAHAEALQLPFAEEARMLVTQALASSS